MFPSVLVPVPFEKVVPSGEIAVREEIPFAAAR
jgi:hypothetical protein